MTQPPTLWIGRKAEECAKWVASAKTVGWEAQALPLLHLEPIPLTDEIRLRLQNLERDDCLFLTSPNGIRIFFENLQESGRLPDCQYAVIGPGSAELLAAGSGQVAGKDARFIAPERRGSSLADIFLDQPARGKLVFFGAESPRPELRIALEAAGKSLQTIAAYRNETLSGPSPPPGQPILLFSPCGAESLALRVQRRSVHPVIALGPTTELVSRALKFPLLGRLSRPTPESLAEFLDHA